jgi:hypothetical protein
MKYLVFAFVLVLATSAFGLEKKAYQMRDDFGMEQLYDGALQFYYYIPCPTYSWFWAVTGWEPGDIIGVDFPIGVQGTGGWDPVDPLNCMAFEQIRVLDFAGYGTVYGGLFTIEFDLWCWDPAQPEHHLWLWNSGPVETRFSWNYIPIDPMICIDICPWGGSHGDHDGPVLVVTATMTGTEGAYPAWGADNISTAWETGCEFHDYGCLPATWPRGAPGIGGVHSGYFGNGVVQYEPPLGFLDGRDTTPDGSQYGFLELAWRVYITCLGPSSAEPSTWGNIKSMYRE